MKVLFQSRTTLFTVLGGDTIQILKTAEALRRLGCQVDISTELEPDLSNYDIVHLFNLMRPQEVYLQALNVKHQGKKVALSTIYVLYAEYERKVRGGMEGWVARNVSPWQVERLKVVARGLVNNEMNKGSLCVAMFGYRNLCNKIVVMTDVFLPNSDSEMQRVHDDFAASKGKPFVVVPNAVDIDIFDEKKVKISEQVNRYKDYVLCVARIEGIKNQLNLVRAVKDLPIDLVLIGKPAPNHLAYFEAVKREAGKRVHILGQVPHDELAQYYKAAKVHALVSWFETTGLSSLEAAAMGCNLVITKKGDTQDYFGDYAFYCEPDSVESIRAAIISAYESPVNPELREHILRNFTWDNAADATIKGYELALAC